MYILFQVRLEKTVVENHEAYVCYTLKAKNQRIVAVVIEMMMISQCHKHSVANIIGNYAAMVQKPAPLVFILSNKTIELVVFPFVNSDGEKLINAVKTPPINLFNDHLPLVDVVAIPVVMLMMCSKDGLFNDIEYTNGDAVKKTALLHVKTMSNCLEEGKKLAEEESTGADKEKKRADKLAEELQKLKQQLVSISDTQDKESHVDKH